MLIAFIELFLLILDLSLKIIRTIFYFFTVLVTTAATFLSSVAGALSTEGGLYIRPEIDEVDEEGFYFEAFEISVETSGTYTLTSESDMDTMGFLYQDSFDPSVPTGNLVNEDDDNGEGVHQFSIEHYFEAGKTYILVVTTHETSETGDFTVKGFGPGSVSLTSFTPTTSQPIGGQFTKNYTSYNREKFFSTQISYSISRVIKTRKLKFKRITFEKTT